MDTTETYIKMCDCPEVQEGWETDLHDYIYRNGVAYLSLHFKQEGDIWLPRQDQLQEMVPNKHMEPDWEPARWPLHLAQVVDEYASATYDYWQEICWQPESMEQLWLAFVMREKHGKAWNGKEWTK